MLESIMYILIGVLAGGLAGLAFVPLVHNRAVRLTTRRLIAALPESEAEIQAQRDLMRAEFAVSTRRLEMTVEQLNNKMTKQLVELGQKSDALHSSERTWPLTSLDGFVPSASQRWHAAHVC